MPDSPGLPPHAPPREALEALAQARHADPFAVLGPHRRGGRPTVCTIQPGARSVAVLARADGQPLGELERVHESGIFCGALRSDAPYRLRIRWNDTAQETEDPYSFGALLGEIDLHLLREGRHHELGRCLGAQTLAVDGVPGVRFAVWAPNARRVSVVGSFNGWDGRRHPMRLRHDAGVWELFVPRLAPGALYKYELTGADGAIVAKADPVARATEPPPATASMVADSAPFRWSDDAWMQSRARRGAPDAAISVYEVHAPSWLRILEDGGRSLTWDELGDRLVPYATGLGFTHLELLPVMEHPFGGSWGYQPLSLFAPTARHGSPAQFARFVDRCHEAGLGVILDWVPGHFPDDAHGLARFDGTPLYEHADPREGFHKDWNTLIYNFGRHEVRGFLIASALEWLERFHVDGLRVDAVASMLYRDYSRSHGEWVPNVHGGRENLEAISFLKEMNEAIAQRCPGAITIAEESTAWPGVSAPVAHGGLGFSYKWNMGWMHDTLRYASHDPVHRRWHHDDLTFGLVYAFSEKFVLPLSHDEVVHGKRSLLGRMPGDEAQRLANLRAYFAFMWAHPGKKLLFMGGEIAQPGEWNHDASPPWDLLDDPRHRGVQRLVRDLNRLYAGEPALHARDCDPAGFQWLVGDDRANSVFAFLRHGGPRPVLVLCNLTPVTRHDYRVGVPLPGAWRELLNSDAGEYGGSGSGNGGALHAQPVPAHGQSASLSLTLPPLGTLFLAPEAP
ncbi:MAG TPA: 1,4-alpha-glucan branching protein GlgB [Candidatus Binatia bacterium]|nr:1,4-alpha-glucan branching protein GlgB [Candidatus Binatia bacterium]